jgi:hypothetical protein
MFDTRVTVTSPITSNLPLFPQNGGPHLGDLDGDGTSDVIWTGAVMGSPPAGTSYIAATYMMNPGTTVPRSISTVSSPTNRVMAVGNFDGDWLRRADVLRRSVNGDVSIALAGGGTMSLVNVSGDWVIKGVGDFNRDQASDVVWYNTSSGLVSIWEMGSGGIISNPLPGTVPPSQGWSIQGIADVDHDGVSDIVWRHTSSVLSIWMMNADGSVREFGAGVPVDATATFAGVLELSAPPAPLNPFIAGEYWQGGQIVASVRFNGQPSRPNDQIEILETDSRAVPYRAPYKLIVGPDVMEAIVPLQFYQGTRACFRIRTWEQGRVSAYSNPLCLPGLSAPNLSLTWRADDGFGLDQNQDGAIDLIPSQDALFYLRDGRWPVTLEACGSNDNSARGTITNYAFTVGYPTGAKTYNTANCRITGARMPKSSVPVTLTITTQDGRTATASTTVDAKRYLIVSLGDSYASGEGNPVRDMVPLSAPAFWGTDSDAACHRSANSGPARSALALERSDPHSAVAFLSVACSGAIIANLSGPQQFPEGLPGPQPAQIQQVKNVLCPAGTSGNCSPGQMPQIDALMLSIGGNDVEFGDIVASCSIDRMCSRDLLFTTFKEVRLLEIPDKLGALRTALTALNAPSVFITEYPDGVHMDHDNICPEITIEGALANSVDLHIGHDDLAWAADFIHRLDQSTATTVGTFPGWRYVGSLIARFEPHGYCMPDTWETHHNVSQRKQGDPRGTLHPNTGGLNAYADAIRLAWSSAGIGASTNVFNFIPPGNVVPVGPQPLFSSSCGTLKTGEGLQAGSSLSSCDGRFLLAMQTDGRLRLYQVSPSGATLLWTNSIGGLTSDSYSVMQGDGNFVTYTSAVGAPVWASSTAGFPGARLVVQNDGNVVVYDTANVPRWASNTCCR